MDKPAPAATSPKWWQNEDWLAVIVGGLLIAAVLVGWRPGLPAFSWMTSGHLTGEIRALQLRSGELEKLQQDAVSRGESGLAGALADLHGALNSAETAVVRGAVMKIEATVGQLKSAETGKATLKFIAPLQSKRTNAISTLLSAGNAQRLMVLGLIYFGIAVAGVSLLGGRATGFLAGFPIVFGLAACAQMV